MSKRLLAFLAPLAVASVFACRPGASQDYAADLVADEAAVRKVEADWAAAAGTTRVEAWMPFYAADAIVLLPHGELVSGTELVRQSVTRLLALPEFTVAWHPIKVEIARSGDLAHVIANYTLRFGDSRGALLAERGRVLEVWRKQTDGMWKCILDTWNSDEPTAPRQAAASPAPMTVPNSEPSAANSAMGPLSPAQAGAVKYGDMPTHYQEAIRQYFSGHLKDPDSAQYREITQPAKGYITIVTGTLLLRETRDYGWKVIATINAKNSHGSYSGSKSYTFLFRGENIVHTLLPLNEDEIN